MAEMMAVASLVATAAGTAVGMYQQEQEGKWQAASQRQDAYNKQKEAQQNFAAEQRNAESMRQQAEHERASMRVATGDQTPVSVLGLFEANRKAEQNMAYYRGQQGVSNARASARLNMIGARNSEAAGKTAAFGTGLSGLASLSSKAYKYYG